MDVAGEAEEAEEEEGGEEGPPRSFLTDQRCDRQVVWKGCSLQEELMVEEVGLKKVKQWRGGSALPSDFTDRRVISGCRDLMWESEYCQVEERLNQMLAEVK